MGLSCELCRNSIDGLNREIAVCWPCQSVPTSNRLRVFLARKADELLEVAGKTKRVSSLSHALGKASEARIAF